MNSASVKALEKAIKANASFWCLCRMVDGELHPLCGLSLIRPFLDGSIEALACNDSETAHLLRGLDAEKRVSIELVWFDGFTVHKEQL